MFSGYLNISLFYLKQLISDGFIRNCQVIVKELRLKFIFQISWNFFVLSRNDDGRSIEVFCQCSLAAFSWVQTASERIDSAGHHD